MKHSGLIAGLSKVKPKQKTTYKTKTKRCPWFNAECEKKRGVLQGKKSSYATNKYIHF